MKFVKRNYLFIIISVILVLFVTFSFISSRNDYNEVLEAKKNSVTECFLNEDKHSPGICLKLQEEFNDEYKTKPSFYDTVSYALTGNYMILDMTLFLLIVIPTLYNLSNLLGDKVILHNMTKEKYSKIKLNILKQGYRYLWFYPTLLIFFFLLCLIVSTNQATTNFLYTDINLASNPIYFIIMYLLNALFLTGTYLNISLIALRIKHNYFLATLISFLIFLVTEVFLFLFVDRLFISSILDKVNYQDLFSIIGIFDIKINNAVNFNLRVFISFSMFFLTFVITYLIYKNKEKLVISVEGN